MDSYERVGDHLLERIGAGTLVTAAA